MITPHLEKLIFEGKAQYKTFVGGFTQKHILPIQQNRFIVITDLWYTPTFYFDPSSITPLADQYKDNMITQLTILGDRGFNRFLFKNSILSDVGLKYSPNNPIHINTFLIHSDGVSLTFSNSEPITGVISAIMPFKVASTRTPGDYGKVGQPGALPVDLKMTTASGYVTEFFGDLTGAGPSNNEYSYPVDTTTDLPTALKTENISYPIVNVGYVEIMGQPTNIGY